MEDDGSEMPHYFAGLPRDPGLGMFAVSHDSRAGNFRKKPWLPEVRPAAWRPGAPEPVAEVVAAIEERKLTAATIGVEMRHLGAAIYQRLAERLPRARFVDAGPLLWAMRSVKSAREIARQRHAYRLGEDVYREVFRMLAQERGLTVGDVRARQMAMATRFGCPPLIFGYVHPFSADGRKAPWTAPSVHEMKIEPGDTLMLDLGLVWRGYSTDFGRCATMGAARPEVRDFYRKLREVRERTAEAIRPGARACDVQAVAARARQERGLNPHPCAGHSLGIECHEPPQLVPHDQTVLEESMTIVIEHYDGFGGAAFLLEDAGVVTPRGWETMTTFDTEVVEIEI